MKFRMINLGYQSTPDYPYGYRIELTEFLQQEREELTTWFDENKISYITAGWNTGSVIYLKTRDASHFVLRWS